MTEWTVPELKTCTAYGMLWLVAHVQHGTMLCYRIRKKKESLYVSSEKKLFKHYKGVERGVMLFRDKNGMVAHLQPNEALAEHIKQVLETL